MERQRSKGERYTYQDYCQWDVEQRWELIDGVAYAMAGPSVAHQTVLGNLFWKFREFLEGKGCKVFIAPCDVRLNADKEDDTVVQPDLFVVCELDKIKEKSIDGAPDLVVEILSPSNRKHDRLVKFKKYREAGVKELWLADPDDGSIETFKLGGGFVDYNIYGVEDTITVGILPELTIDLSSVFETRDEDGEDGSE